MLGTNVTIRFAAEIADAVVPEYRNGERSYSCTGLVAKRWSSAYEAALRCFAPTKGDGEIETDEGKFKIAECRRFTDLIHPEYSPLADVRNEEMIDLRDHGIEPIAPTVVKADEPTAS